VFVHAGDTVNASVIDAFGQRASAGPFTRALAASASATPAPDQGTDEYMVAVVATDSMSGIAGLSLPVRFSGTSDGTKPQRATPHCTNDSPWTEHFPATDIYDYTHTLFAPFTPQAHVIGGWVGTMSQYGHFPMAIFEAPAYGVEVYTPLAPPDPALTKIAGFDVPANTPSSAVSALARWLVVHGGDPLPDQMPGIDQRQWLTLRRGLKPSTILPHGVTPANFGRHGTIIRLPVSTLPQPA
jgi:hypothetical protein